MRAFIPRKTRNRQTFTYHRIPEIHGSALPTGAELRRIPEIHGSTLPTGAELRRIPEIHGSALAGTATRQRLLSDGSGT